MKAATVEAKVAVKCLNKRAAGTMEPILTAINKRVSGLFEAAKVNNLIEQFFFWGLVELLLYFHFHFIILNYNCIIILNFINIYILLS